MLRRHWLRGLFARNAVARRLRGERARARRGCRPLTEALEARVLPAVTFQFDYSRDTAGFFDDGARRATLEQAGSMLGDQLNDVLFEIIPHQLDPADTWTAQFVDPSDGMTFDVIDPIIGEDVIVIYVGGRNLGGALAFGGPASIPTVSGVQEFVDTVLARGQLGALDATPTDYGPFGGTVTFNTTTNWHFGESTTGLDAGEFDFLSTALHELAHVIGFGTAPSFMNLVSGGLFTGGQSSVEYGLGGSVPLQDPGHWRQGLFSDGQEVALDPDLADGERKLLTSLDLAALSDIGWEVDVGSLTPPSITLAGLGGAALLISDNGTPNDGMSQYTINGGGPIEFETTTGDIFIQGGAGADTVTFDSIDGMFDGDFFLNGGGGDDLLDVDYSLSDSFTYNGQGGNDSLALQGATTTQVEHSFFNASDGTVAIDSAASPNVFYTGLEPIEDRIPTTTRIFSFLDGADDITIDDDGIALNGLSRIRSVSSSETVHFSHLTTSVIVDAAGGDDIVSILSLDGLFTGPVSVIGGAGNDTLNGLPASIPLHLAGNDGNDTLTGGSAADTIDGAAGADSIVGGAGGDVLTGGDDNDHIDGGSGADSIDGDAGDDNLIGGDGNDTLNGAAGADSLNGGAGDDILNASVGDDSLDGGSGNDELDGSDGADVLAGGDDDDTLRGGLGNDQLIGGAGNDVVNGDDGDDDLTGGDGNDIQNGGDGTDRLVEAADSNITVTANALTGIGNDVFTNIELAEITGGVSANNIDLSLFTGPATVFAGDGDDTVTGTAQIDSLLGEAGADLINGGGANDRIFGGSGEDTLNGDAGDDFLRGESEADVVNGGDGADIVNGNQGRDTVSGGGGDDLVLGGGGPDTLFGGDGNDRLLGQSGFDVLTGDTGNDTLDGGRGSDRVIESADSDFTVRQFRLTGNGTDRLRSIERVEIDGGVGSNTLDASSFNGRVTLRGGDGDDTLIGGADNDGLNGQEGNDSLVGNGGADVLLGGAGTDTLEGNDGDDTLDGEAGSGDRLFGGVGNDSLIGGSGADRLFGDDGNDTLEGGGGSDRLFGGLGDDSLRGGDQNDQLFGEDGHDTLIGDAGNDTLNGGQGRDGLDGVTGNDLLKGAGADDTLFGGEGSDTLEGEGGADLVIGLGGADRVNGGGSTDTLIGGSGSGADIGDVSLEPAETDEFFAFTPPGWLVSTI